MAFSKLKSIIKKFNTDTLGNVAVIAGVAAVPIMFSVGAAVDYSRYSRGFGKMVDAGDAAIFAASKKMSGSGENNDTILQQELETEFDNFMEANFNADEYNIDFEYDLNFSRDDQTVTVDIEGSQDTAFLKVLSEFGLDQLNFSTTLGTRLETTPENYVMDIIMCIDATGSMQNTLDSVQANASTFDTQLRDELNIDHDDARFKVRIRPIYFRDWDDTTGGYGWHWVTTAGTGYYIVSGRWRYGYTTGPHYEYGSYSGDLEDGIKIAPDFYDLDNTAESAAFQSFLSSETAHGGGDAPEAAGACLNEGMRSDWYDRDETSDFPDDENVTVFPILVTWTDNSIQNLSTTQQYLSDTQPTSYSSFETQWENPSILPQDPKLLILFGPETWSGWNTIRNWDNYEYGGSITTGNADAISVIADKIIKVLPDVLRLTH